ncbi:hypothetical protein H2203_005165 [Taxawa tesnikishii (nom. ined.)]|nr:hypothetical protein H2203_005165 [Dothideales sp. JES 119]
MAEGEWAGVRDEKLKTNPLQSIPATMHEGMRFKLREAVRKSRSTATASIKATLERLVCSRHRSVAFRKKWARKHIPNALFECKDGKSAKRYTSHLIMESIRSAYFGAGRAGVHPLTAKLFRPLSPFLIVSVCATLQSFLNSWATGTCRSDKTGEPIYPDFDSNEAAELFEEKWRTWSTQCSERQELIQSRLTEAVLATLKKDPYMDKFVDVTDMQKWANTLAGLTSEESSNSEEIDSGEDLNKASLRKGQPSSPSKSSYRAAVDYAMPRESDDAESDDDLTSRDTATQSKPPQEQGFRSPLRAERPPNDSLTRQEA